LRPARPIAPDLAEGIEREEAVTVALAFYEGLSYPEIVTLLDIPAGTVKSRMFHAKGKLAEALR